MAQTFLHYTPSTEKCANEDLYYLFFQKIWLIRPNLIKVKDNIHHFQMKLTKLSYGHVRKKMMIYIKYIISKIMARAREI